MNIQNIRLTRFGKVSIIVLLLTLSIGIPTYRYIMNPIRVMKSAFKQMDIDKLKWAIDHGASVDSFIQNTRPIALAFNKGRHDFMEVIAKAGATLNLRSTNGVSFIGKVVAANDSTALDILGKHGANFNRKADTLNRNVLSHIIAEGKSHLIPVATKYADLNTLDDNGKTPLHYAGSHIDSSAIGYLIEQGANPMSLDTSGNTPLHLITDVATIEVFHTHGVNLDTLNGCGVPPMAYYLAHGKQEAFVYLVNNGASLDWKDQNGHNAIHYAYLSKSSTLANLVATSFRERHPEQVDQFLSDFTKTAIGGSITYLATRKATQAALGKTFKPFLKRKGLRMVGKSIVPVAGLLYTVFTIRRTIREAKELYRQWEDGNNRIRQLEKEVSELRTQLWEQHSSCMSP